MVHERFDVLDSVLNLLIVVVAAGWIGKGLANALQPSAVAIHTAGVAGGLEDASSLSMLTFPAGKGPFSNLASFMVCVIES